MNERETLLALLREHSFKRGKFTLTSGRESDVLFDCKHTVLRAEGHALVGHLMLRAVQALQPVPVAVAGVELGGCPLASAVALISAQEGTPIDAIYVRKDAKEHGSKRVLEGATHLAKGAPVAVLEDAITTGGSTLKAVEKLRAAELAVVGVVAIVDRLEGGGDAIRAAGLAFSSLYTRHDFIPPDA